MRITWFAALSGSTMMLLRLCVPRTRQPVIPLSKSPLSIMALPVFVSTTVISSIRHSPPLCRPMMKSFHCVGCPLPAVGGARVYEYVCHVDLPVSSLAAHDSAFELSALGLRNSRLDPPPAV